MPIHPLPIFSDEEELAAIEKLRPPKTVVVRFGFLKNVAELPYDGDQIIGCGAKLVVRTSRGVELAEMLTVTCSNSGCGKSISRKQMLDYIENSGGKQYPFSTDGKVLRVATVEDLNLAAKIESEKMRFVKLGRETIKALDLPMKLVDVEELFSRDKVVFYFTSEDRIDFRELVRRLAADLHVRIEMRQVGARDEARLVADYEKCGQHCCCKQFLKVLKPVSMRSAKVQKATLDPSKISGRCGRLMCCLRYEDETYEDLRKRLPNRKTRVKTDDGIGTVVSSQILTQLVMVELDGSYKRFAYPLENIEILKGDAAIPPPPRPAPGEEGDRRGGRGPRPEGRGDRGPGGPGGPGAPGGPGGRPQRDGQRDQRDNRDGGNRDSAGGEARQPRDGGPRDGRPQRDRRSEPPRPRPGRPLQDDQVESREGEPSAELLDETLKTPLAEPGVNLPEEAAAELPLDGIDDGDSGEDGADEGGEGAADGQNPGGPVALGADGQPLRKKRRRRRRRRRGGGPGGPGGPSAEGGGPGLGGDGGGGPPAPPPAE